MASNYYTQYGECRFCSAKGDHQDITKEYTHNSIREVYVDTILECFNLFLTIHASVSMLICRSCVSRLRDAVSFREMVASAERKLIDLLNDTHEEETVFINVPNRVDNIQMKIEPKIERVSFEEEDFQELDYETDQSLTYTATSQLNKRCIVPKCRNVTTLGQGKLFFPVPTGAESRRRWLKATRRKRLGGGESCVCEDHFDIENDTRNYLDHKLDGATLELRPGVVPHLFDCHTRKSRPKENGIVEEDLACDRRVKEEESSLFLEKSDVAERVQFVEGEAELRMSFASARPLPTCTSLHYICPEYVKHLRKLKGKNITARKIEKQFTRTETKHRKRSVVSEKLALTTNACALLENSNATVFKTKMRAGYPCFYCRQIFLNLETLQRHQTVHPKANLFKLLSKYTADELVVYADVTELKCTRCHERVPSLHELKSHLPKVHEVKMYTGYTDRVVPFKLTDKDFECQICGFTFETFGSVEKHMSTHYRNYICAQCGAGFVTNHRLKIHTSLVHRRVAIECDVCKKSFNSRLKFKIHYGVVHNKVMLNKCPKCPERFIDYFTRRKHLVDVHGEKPILYKCKVCDKTFKRRYMLSCHVKRTHLEQKDCQCELCPYMCYNKGELREHMLKHTGEKAFVCSVCKKAFARKKSLDVHMRIHNNDRRFACNLCGQTFVHKCSLKGHLRSHHARVVGNMDP